MTPLQRKNIALTLSTITVGLVLLATATSAIGFPASASYTKNTANPESLEVELSTTSKQLIKEIKGTFSRYHSPDWESLLEYLPARGDQNREKNKIIGKGKGKGAWSSRLNSRTRSSGGLRSGSRGRRGGSRGGARRRRGRG